MIEFESLKIEHNVLNRLKARNVINDAALLVSAAKCEL